MSYYRLYFMNVSSGHIDRVRDLQARDDLEAIETARPFSGSVPVELWDGLRKIYRFEAAQTASKERFRQHRASAQHDVTSTQPAAE